MKVTTWRRFPIAICGYDCPRVEFGGGLDKYMPEFSKRFFWWRKDPNYGVTHIQYESRFGFLITWPFCMTFWYQFQPPTWYQKSGDDNPSRVPGSEKVIFISIGWARWDAGSRCYMVPRCFIGGNYD